MLRRFIAFPYLYFHQNDHLIWHHENNGSYTIKSGYKMALLLEEQQLNTSNTTAVTWWKKFWSLSIPSKVRIFLWRTIQVCLPVLDTLHTRHISDTSLCSLCHREKDTIIHALFHCKRPRKFWKLSNFSIDSLLSTHVSLKELMIHVSTIWSTLQLEQFACILWSLWTKRNKERHGTKPHLIELLLFKAISYLEEFHSACMPKGLAITHQQAGLQSNQPSPKWLNPPSGRLKLNTNASVNKAKQIYGFGAILQNSSGDCIAAMSRPFPDCFKPEIIEVLALIHILQWIKDLQLPVDYIESDSLVVINGLQSQHASFSDFHCLLIDILLSVFNFPGVQITHVKRCANTVTHTLANYALSVSTDCLWLEELPPPLMSIVL
uniref:Uncharacterized protein n=1 Tax=Cannabis sativa TaxID=3483 RepID=A0A803P5E3_CANSA